MVEPWEKKWTGVIFGVPLAILGAVQKCLVGGLAYFDDTKKMKESWIYSTCEVEARRTSLPRGLAPTDLHLQYIPFQPQLVQSVVHPRPFANCQTSNRRRHRFETISGWWGATSRCDPGRRVVAHELNEDTTHSGKAGQVRVGACFVGVD